MFGGQTMKSYAKDLPTLYRLFGNRVKLRKNIVEVQFDDDIQYQFDEVEVYLQSRENLEQYIVDNFDALFYQGQKNEKQKEAEIAQDMLDKTDWIESQLSRYERLYGKDSAKYQEKLDERLPDLLKREAWEWTIKEYRML
jgi:Cft2 family RNA processing exonuclease